MFNKGKDFYQFCICFFFWSHHICEAQLPVPKAEQSTQWKNYQPCKVYLIRKLAHSFIIFFKILLCYLVGYNFTLQKFPVFDPIVKIIGKKMYLKEYLFFSSVSRIIYMYHSIKSHFRQGGLKYQTT